MKKGKIFLEVLKRVGVLIFLFMALNLWAVIPAFALQTADVTVNATPAYVSISCNGTALGWNFGVVAASSTTNTTNTRFEIDNLSTVITNQSIKVTTTNWTSAGIDWVHNDAATIGADQAALIANKGGGGANVNVKFAAAFENIATNQAATTDYTFGLTLLAPSSFSDGTEKTNTCRITATAA